MMCRPPPFSANGGLSIHLLPLSSPSDLLSLILTPQRSTRLVDLDVSVNLVHEHGGAPNSDGPADEEQRHAEEQHVSKVERHLRNYDYYYDRNFQYSYHLLTRTPAATQSFASCRRNRIWSRGTHSPRWSPQNRRPPTASCSFPLLQKLQTLQS